MTTIDKLMLNKIAVKMKRFNMNEIQQLLKILHLDLEWKDVVELVAECRMRLNVANIVSVIFQYLRDQQSITEVYHRIMLSDVIYHQSGSWWTVTLDKVKNSFLDKERIRNNIQAMFDKLNIKGVTYVMKCNQLFWVLIDINEMKKSKTNPKLSAPLFLTIMPGTVSHIFYKPHNIDSTLLKIVVKSVGATRYKPYPLSGKHLQSMVNFLEDKNKENNAINSSLKSNYCDEDVREYIRQLFGDKNRVLNQFTINVESDLSMIGINYPTGKLCKARVELKSENIIEGIKDMMLSGVLQPPYPDWVTKLPILGKNSVNINICS
ncbi:uncharacterized protein LOC126895115 [Daktulosphaira vitifoliae]|uniref:uncharacterized protein LOC126895115 n=1 Tax=Daktulosphaira vitifoliae TaxID=58002 RepID=UPI0021A98090|nr:uncharacterized protein LOC126895115 [Daktulosphaira vitifoliae]XP_050522576.1 uncharacterized protein LOC126895115 [Daktulosphaira vitifoliae]XP_050522577.1 uncharacterized protein LOC126895115 [Daktulosphaira vitifoliae]XP_050522579.1 uncharacterized protein LOC126895115 [Daktulosphaira vitifoliae]XP_050522580.1 uncharacterized protein LOC126895115 [Daktulosphaira vitifoliae]